ncbi:MAG: glycosyltransferase family 4 protein [Gaiellaceae bacterium]
MRIVVVSGIWPPDVGGPASHAPEIAAALAERGHGVTVVTTASSAPEGRPYPVRWVSRRLPPGIRHLVAIGAIAHAARTADVVYATSMLQRSSFGARLVGCPFVAKVAGDPAYERARRRGLFEGTLDEFQGADVGLPAAWLRRLRSASLRRAAHVVCPSDFLRRIVISWGLPVDRVSVVPNAAPPTSGLASRDELRAAHGFVGPTLVFAGRLTAAKALDVALAAVAQVDGVTLLVAGDGEERSALEAAAGGRVRFLGAVPRARTLELFRAADAAVLSSRWENFPHALVEALAVGTPVVATDVGGVPEIVEDGVNGLLVAPGDPAALAAAIGRLVSDPELRGRLAAAAAPSVARFAPGAIAQRLEEVLLHAARSTG